MLADMSTSFKLTSSELFCILVKEVIPDTNLDCFSVASAILMRPAPLTVPRLGIILFVSSPFTLKSVLKFPFTNPAIGAYVFTIENELDACCMFRFSIFSAISYLGCFTSFALYDPFTPKEPPSILNFTPLIFAMPSLRIMSPLALVMT